MTAPKPIPHWRQIVACFNEAERYVFDERIGILCEDREPDPVQAAYGIADVREWQARLAATKGSV